MTEKGGAYSTTASDTNFRKKWDKEEYSEKARKRDEEDRERAQENEARMRQGSSLQWFSLLRLGSSRWMQGKKPRKGKREDLPKPTQLMKQREGSLELEKNLNKTIVVQNPGGRGPGQPGFYCDACNRTYKDSTGYLDHINSRARKQRSLGFCVQCIDPSLDLRVLGQTTRIERSTVAQVRERIAFLREKTKEQSEAKSFDFDKRIAQVRAAEVSKRALKKAQKKAAKEHARIQLAGEADDEMSSLMGFGGFGSTKK